MRVTRRERIYNSRIPKMLSSRRCFSLLTLLAVLLAASAFANEWQAPAEQLARKIAGVTGPGAVALTVQNRSSLTRNESDEIRRRMLTELGALGLHFVNADQASATIELTLSEAQHSYVWVAEIRQGANEPAIVMVSTPRVLGGLTERQKPATTIKKALVWTDQNRILDVATLSGNPQHMIVLEGENVLVCSQQGGRWQIDQTLPIVHPRPWPRDLRGRLVLRKDHLFDAYLPGMFCRSSTSAPLAISCRESDDPWPLASEPFALSGFFASSRNFFTGVLSPGIQKQTAVAPFYSAAPLPREKYTLWIFVATDGQLHLLDGITDQAAGRVGWGSDIAAVRSSCGSGWQIIADTKTTRLHAMP